MKNNKMRMIIVPLIYVLAISSFLTSIYFLQKSLTSNDQGKDKNDNEFVYEDGDDDSTLPVSKTEELFVKPFVGNDVTPKTGFYDKDSEASIQEQSIISTVGNNTIYYTMSNGVIYSSEVKFDVNASLSGEVVTVQENDAKLGKYIVVKSDNGLQVTYASLSDVTVKVGDKVTQGQKLASCGTNGLNTESSNQLILYVQKDSLYLNAEQFYNKKISEIQ